ncbi:putative 4-hydroxy-2-oxoglutarate aldolase, mitochondrial isoform X2 [Penaeus vannamei]|uniref:Putative 4-hydroxy-2-oxoglutarate aldolase, mitochondrial isoform X2 n=1 Tax=Penaeus vannamei TaxID=6689 RepID=A0A3R7MPB2_PENVA|nr:putative 4-hydroxy-2-oxoglutarate aldolase, mitochondrial isoform X2 [Penaeus vannamei]
MAHIAKGLTIRICQLTALRVCQRRSLSLSVPRGAAVAPSKRVDLGGVFPPMPTPFNPDESVNYDKFATNIEAWNKAPFKGLVVQGSNGEYVYLSTEERIDLVKCVRDSLPRDSGKIILAGSGCESTRATIEMSRGFMGMPGGRGLLRGRGFPPSMRGAPLLRGPQRARRSRPGSFSRGGM